MCGLHLIVSQQQVPEGAVRAMVQAASHRGPDGQATGKDTVQGLQLHWGHNLMAQQDLPERSAQPWQAGDHHLLWNGQVYGLEPLRNRLQDQVLFRSHTDTEVLAHHLASGPLPDQLATLQGMFAGALWSHQRLQLFRDAWGQKPLYYYHGQGVLVVSSELPSLFASGLVPGTVSQQALAHYAYFGHCPVGATLWHQVREVLPGQVLTWQGDQLSEAHFEHQPSAAGSLQEQLTSALLECSHSRFAPALLLSGGVDSTLLLALAKEAGLDRLVPYALVQSPKAKGGSTDHAWAHRAARHYGYSPQQIALDQLDLPPLQEYFDQVGQPYADPAGYMHYVLAQHISQQTRVAISGLGADELFMGYRRHRLHHWVETKGTKALDRRLALGRMASLMMPRGTRRSLNAIRERRASPLPLDHAWLASAESTWLFRDTLAEKLSLPQLSGPLHQHDQQHYLPGQLLRMADHSTMASAVEVRYPYLQLRQLAQNYSITDLLDRKGKGPLKELLTNLGGADFAKRKKQGMGLPLGHLFAGPWRQPVEDLLANPHPTLAEHFKPGALERLVEKSRKHHQSSNNTLWGLLHLQHYLNK